MLNFEFHTVGRLGCNCVFVWEQESGLGVVVDPGDEADKISVHAEGLGIKMQAILLTHAHFDHMGGAAALQELWGCPLYLHPEDFPLLDQLDEQTEHFRYPAIQKPNAKPFGDGLPLQIETVHTPGHSPGSSAFLFDSAKGRVALVGDTLFCRSVGRTDLMGGSREALENSIRTKLYTLDPDTIVIPGHGPDTTIGLERSKNQFVRG